VAAGAIAGAVVPHAPVLLPDIGGRSAVDARDRLQFACDKIDTVDADVLIVVSPHGRKSGVYARGTGSETSFGGPEAALDVETDSGGADALARAWSVPLMDDELDHGAVGCLHLLDVRRPTVIVALQESTGPGAAADACEAIVEGRKLAAAVKRAFDGSSVLMVASAHTSAALTPRAPLTERAEGRVLDERILSSLKGDLRTLDEIECDAWTAGGSCGAGPFAALGRLLPGRSAQVLAYEHPFGVGYLVATVT
jgi:aromatic ring-opening dioxygenase LigB subunit